LEEEEKIHPFGSAHQVTSVGLHESGAILKHKPLCQRNGSDKVEDRVGSAHQATGVGLHESGAVSKHKQLCWKIRRDAPR